MSIQVLREKLLTILSGLEGVRLVYVFGSQVRGPVGPMSDYIVERNLEVAVQCCIDVCNRIISLEGARKPTDYYDAILSMGQIGVLPADFARYLAPLAGFRDTLVHEYLMLDWDEVYRVLHRLEDLEQFALLIREWLQHRNTPV